MGAPYLYGMNTLSKGGTTLVWSLVTSLLLTGFLSCTQSTSFAPLADVDLLDFQTHYMSSFNANTSTAVKVQSRATITLGSGAAGSKTFASGQTWATLKTNSAAVNQVANYPDAGQTTSFTVADTLAANVYRITATTTFASGDARSSYREVYHVQDVAPMGTWTEADAVGSLSGTTFTANIASRASMTLTFANGDLRDEAILSNTTLYAMPSISGSLNLTPSSEPAVVTSGVAYSSVVGYVTKPTSLNASSLWTGLNTNLPNVIGLRFYSEQNGVWSMVSFERITKEEQDLSSLTLADLEAVIFTGKKKTTTYTTLATSVLRENATTKAMQTRLVSNVKNLTYTLSLDTTGTLILVSTSDGNLIQTGL